MKSMFEPVDWLTTTKADWAEPDRIDTIWMAEYWLDEDGAIGVPGSAGRLDAVRRGVTSSANTTARRRFSDSVARNSSYSEIG